MPTPNSIDFSERRDSKSIVVVDEDCGIPTSIVDNYRSYYDNGPLAQSDPRSFLLSMSDYNKPQNYDVYEYSPATRPEPGQDYAAFGAQQTYPSQYVATQAQVPSGLPQSTALSMVPPAQHYSGPHDPTYYPQQYAQPPAYVEPPPRQIPEIISYLPTQGQQGTRVNVYFRSIYDLDQPPIRAFLMFGANKCESQLMKTAQQGQMYQYSISADAPPPLSPNSPSSVSLHLVFDENLIQWDSPTLEFGSFTYVDPPPAYYPTQSPEAALSNKRKLSPQASPRRSPTKKPSIQHLAAPSRPLNQPYPAGVPTITPSSPFRRPSLPDAYSHTRRFSGPEYQPAYNAPLPTPHQYYGGQGIVGHSSPSLQQTHSPSWGYHPTIPMVTRSPSGAPLSAGSRTSNILPSPANASNPPLIRTSTLQQSPTTPGTATSTPTFNPYLAYPSNAKAMLKIEGELNSMVDGWTVAEMDARRRLVQFSRSQTGSVITATFEAVTPEGRAPNSICVSCIWWEEKNECYVTSVDTISLLEALVAVRFTVEEKNRIRRNLEGFRPATVSKAKADSEEFFKLIMGFPSPKPRNIEKDVKVFPWRILAGALKKIIGKYASHPCPRDAYASMQASSLATANHTSCSQSASYSSTAGALHTPASSSYATRGGPDTGIDAQAPQRPAASPRSTSSSVTSHGHAYAPTHTLATHAYSPHHHAAASAGGLGLGPSGGPPDLRLAVPVPAASQTTSWHPASQYNDLSAATQHNRQSWEFNNYMTGSSPATGLPGSVPSYQYQQHLPGGRLPSFTTQPAMPSEARFVPLHDYEEQQGHQTTIS